MAESLETIRLIDRLTSEYGGKTTDKLISYIDMVLERNEYINLTAVRDRDEAMQKHLADSLSICSLREFIDSRRIIDIGTGAGFPGALLAIAYPEKEFILLDSTLKRLRVIEEFASVLGINNITTVHARAEEISRKAEYANQFDLCVSRAVADLSKLAEWCLPFVRRGGFFIPYKGDKHDEELNNAINLLNKHNSKYIRTEYYGENNPLISGHVLIVIRKN